MGEIGDENAFWGDLAYVLPKNSIVEALLNDIAGSRNLPKGRGTNE